MTVLVVGAGVAGLVAARRLTDAGHRVTVLDKGRVVGGRTASREVAPGRRHDQGAQFITLQHDEVADLTDRMRDRGALTPWFHGAPDVTSLPRHGRDAAVEDGHPRFRGAPSARAPAELLADGLDTVRTTTRVTSTVVADGRWQVHLDDGTSLGADAIVLTPPAPQTSTLLAGQALAEPLQRALSAVRYEPCWTVLAAPDATPGLPSSGAARLDHDVIAFVVDEQRKGTATRPAVTIHSTGAWASDHLEDDHDDVGRALVAAAEPLLGVALTVAHVHRWRYATPVAHGDDPAPTGHATGTDGSRAPLALAGDGYVGGRVEGAMRSGHLAAAAVADLLSAD